MRRRNTVAAERQTVEHRRRALRSPIAWIGTGRCKRNRPGAFENRRSGLEQQAHFPMSSVIPERDGRSIGGTDATMGREHQELVAAERGGIPTHAGVLRPPEQIARGALSQHFGRQRQDARWSASARGDLEQRSIV
jgi:hypothetical protein